MVLHPRRARRAQGGKRWSRGDSLELEPSECTAGDAGPGPEQLWEQQELAANVVAALAKLPPTERTAIVQRYYLGFTEAQMAAASGSPRGTVKWRLYAARQRLRPLLQPFMSESEVLK